jgi:hypothetical protein
MVDWRRLPQPPAVPPDDLGSGETLDDDERAWLRPNRGPARRRTALLLGLAVVAVIVSLLAYRRFQR